MGMVHRVIMNLPVTDNNAVLLRKYQQRYEVWLIRVIRIGLSALATGLTYYGFLFAGLTSLSLAFIWSDHISRKRTDRRLDKLKERTKGEFGRELERDIRLGRL